MLQFLGDNPPQFNDSCSAKIPVLAGPVQFPIQRIVLYRRIRVVEMVRVRQEENLSRDLLRVRRCHWHQPDACGYRSLHNR